MSENILPKLVPCSDDFIPVSLEDILEIESILGVRLPDDYREFVQKYGWSCYSPLAAVQAIEKPPLGLYATDDKSYLPFAAFYGGDYMGENLLDDVRSGPYKEYYPENMIAIANDISTSQYLLAVDGEHKNKIFFWFYDGFIEADYYLSVGKEIPADWQYQNMCLVANSFTDMLSRIILDPEIID